jgi:phage gpG-like protein
VYQVMKPGAQVMPFPAQADAVSFNRAELAVILGLYGRMVAAGIWRDYGISLLREVAIFSVFRHTAEHALYRIEKRPKLAARQGQYAVLGMDGRILKRGHDLAQVLRPLEAKLIRAVDP